METLEEVDLGDEPDSKWFIPVLDKFQPLHKLKVSELCVEGHGNIDSSTYYASEISALSEPDVVPRL